MLNVLSHPAYARLFFAQVVALVGTGLLTVALGLLAFELAGERAGAVLGTVFAIKMIAYVGLAPLASALATRLPRKTVLVGADLLRAGVALILPLVDATWQIYLLIFALQAASATFTPAFQALIPEILEDEADYTRALSLSRLAYDLENLFSPALAGILLMVTTFHWLFGGTAAGFIGSALLVMAAPLPDRRQTVARPFAERLTRGLRIYLATPRLRGLLALNLAAAAAGAFVIVNTVVIVRVGHGAANTAVAIALAAFGGGSMLSALVLPRVLERFADRRVMLSSAGALSLLTLAHAVWLIAAWPVSWSAFLGLWALSGLFYSAILTPTGRLLRRSSQPDDRPALFAAQFALSHACWLLTYPLAGWAGQVFGLPIALAIVGMVALFGATLAIRLWPQDDPETLVHSHPDLPAGHPHLGQGRPSGTQGHSHVFIIDDLHPGWPR